RAASSSMRARSPQPADGSPLGRLSCAGTPPAREASTWSSPTIIGTTASGRRHCSRRQRAGRWLRRPSRPTRRPAAGSPAIRFGAAARRVRTASRALAWSSFADAQAAGAGLALDSLRHDPATAEFAAELPDDPGELVVDVTPVGSTSAPDGIDLGDCRPAFHVLEGHSTSDLVVRLPEFGIVFTGDLVEEGDPPQAGADAALSRWVDS